MLITTKHTMQLKKLRRDKLQRDLRKTYILSAQDVVRFVFPYLQKNLPLIHNETVLSVLSLVQPKTLKRS